MAACQNARSVCPAAGGGNEERGGGGVDCALRLRCVVAALGLGGGGPQRGRLACRRVCTLPGQLDLDRALHGLRARCCGRSPLALCDGRAMPRQLALRGDPLLDSLLLRRAQRRQLRSSLELLGGGVLGASLETPHVLLLLREPRRARLRLALELLQLRLSGLTEAALLCRLVLCGRGSFSTGGGGGGGLVGSVSAHVGVEARERRGAAGLARIGRRRRRKRFRFRSCPVGVGEALLIALARLGHG
mmetsp:Transcript_8054/g.23825  ORF Transcript_8054/g.23825 Transcript_8054/m.23825 type:complete len:246 (-) Transcript_8054:128-865(-)